VVTEEEDRRQEEEHITIHQCLEEMQLSSLEYPKSKKGHAEHG